MAMQNEAQKVQQTIQQERIAKTKEPGYVHDDYFKRTRLIMTVAAIYIGFLICSNLGSLRILAFGDLALNGGALLFPFGVVLRDLLHKKAGARMTRHVILLAAGINLLLFALLWLVAQLPAHPAAGLQLEYTAVFSPSLRLALGSVSALTLAELVDTGIYVLVRRHYGLRKQWLRVLLSNLVSIPLDTVVFLLIAYLGRLPGMLIGQIAVVNIGYKYLLSFAGCGLIYFVKDDVA